MNKGATAKKHGIADWKDGWYVVERGRAHSDQLADRLDTLERALDEGDGDTWAEVARALTDTTARLGSMRMMKLCIALQMQGRRQLVAKARETLDELRFEFERFKENLIPAG